MIHQNNNSRKILKPLAIYSRNTLLNYIFIALITIFFITSCTDSDTENNSENSAYSNPSETSSSIKSTNQPKPINPDINSSNDPTATSIPTAVAIATVKPKSTAIPSPAIKPSSISLPTPESTVNPVSLNTTPIPTVTPSPTQISTATPTFVPVATPSHTPTPTGIPTSTATATPSPTATATPSPTATATATPSPTATPTPIYVASNITSPCVGYISPKTQPTAIPEPTPTITSFLNPLAYPTPTSTTNTAFARNRYSYDAKKYFLDIAFGPEYYVSGNKCLEANPYLHKWVSDITIRVQGYPTNEDIETVSSVITQLNDLTQTIDISLVEKGGNIQLYFIPENQFVQILPSYIPTNWGFFWVLWDSKGNIYRSTILIDSSRISQRARNHLIKEEITQSLGLMKDSDEYINSIFYQKYTYTQSLSTLDTDLVELLYNYDPGFISGTSLQEAKTILSME